MVELLYTGAEHHNIVLWGYLIHDAGPIPTIAGELLSNYGAAAINNFDTSRWLMNYCYQDTAWISRHPEMS